MQSDGEMEGGCSDGVMEGGRWGRDVGGKKIFTVEKILMVNFSNRGDPNLYMVIVHF